tara:strand:- start:6103 stop:6666 length:564 start_codon:yes stop_codon:yes gene_type:complete
MAEETQNTETTENQNLDTKVNVKNDVPYDRFQEVNQQKNEFKGQLESLQSEIAKMKSSKEAERQEAMKKNEEFETLYTETQAKLDKQTTINEGLKKDVDGFRAGLLEQLPEERREFGTSMDMATLQKFVSTELQTANADKTNQSRPGNQPGGEFGGYSSHAEWATKDPKGYQEANNSINGQGIKIGY